MARRTAQQIYAFTSGVLDDRLEARSDLKAYYAGAKTIENMVGLAHGGLKVRSGLMQVAEVTDLIATGDDSRTQSQALQARLLPFAFSTDEQYLLLFLGRCIVVYHDGLEQVRVNSPWNWEDLAALNWTQSLDTMILVHPAHPPQRLMRQGSHRKWIVEALPLANIPSYDFDGPGKARKEPVWSNKRGWPHSVYLHEGRLYFGGSRSRPQTIWGSRANDFFNFASSSAALDDEAVEMTLDGDRVSAIEQLYALGDFFAFSSGGVFVHQESPVTPQNFHFQRHCEIAAGSLPPVEIDGTVAFVRRDQAGNLGSLYELSWDDSRQGYVVQNLALLAGSLVQGARDLAVQESGGFDSAALLYLVKDDGSLALLNSNRAQQITAWSHLTTSGDFLAVAVISEEVICLTQRVIAGQKRFFLERLASDCPLDAALYLEAKSPQSSWTDSNLSTFEGEVLSFVGDGERLGNFKVEGGSVTLPWAVNRLWFGLPFQWSLQTMPVESRLSSGTLIGRKHRLLSATLQLRSAREVSVNGRPLSFADSEGKLQPFDGQKSLRFLGWQGREQGASLRLEGRGESPLLLLGLQIEIAH